MSNKTLAEWLEFISNTHPSEIEMGLGRIRSVFNDLNLITNSAKKVLVAGTNGKGSTVAMIEASLLALGFSVGTYTSPHILSYNERVRINGVNVSDLVLEQAFTNVEAIRKKTPLTYFEYGTLAALEILFTADLDVVLLEVGLGGRLDAVNIVDPDISIITSIGIDHADWLGNTVDIIGLEKAGILRSNSIFVAGEAMPQTVLSVSHTLACKTLICRDNFDFLNENESRGVYLNLDSNSHKFDGFPDVLLPENNILVSMQSVACLFGIIKKESQIFDQSVYNNIVSAINTLKLPGRLEKITHPKVQNVYIDVGHNPHAAAYLYTFLAKFIDINHKIQIVYSSLIDKDVLGVLTILAPLVDRCILVPLNAERAMPLESLVNNAGQSGIKNVLSFNSVEDGISDSLSYALKASDGNEPVLTLIFGSFYMVEAAKRFFETYE